MTTTVLICDDASFARKQMARALLPGWDVTVNFASDGAEALDAIRDGKGDVLFLDLNMPGMDGYAVLETIRREDLPTMAIVVSGDVQPEAHARVMKLGALAFLRKPVTAAEVEAVLRQYGVQYANPAVSVPQPLEVQVNLLDGYQEIANIAMGRAADFLARLLNAFVLMPVPRVNVIEVGELRMVLTHVESAIAPGLAAGRASEASRASDSARGPRLDPIGDRGTHTTAVCQGFIGKGIAGEALLMFNESGFEDIARLMNHTGTVDAALETELLMDVSNVLIGACLKGIAEQLDLEFSQGHPMVLGRHTAVADLLRNAAGRWRQTLAIEMSCRVEHHQVSCDLLFLFTEDSLAFMNERVAWLID